MIALREIFHSPEAMSRIDRCDAGGNCEGCELDCKSLGHGIYLLLLINLSTDTEESILVWCVCVMA